MVKSMSRPANPRRISVTKPRRNNAWFDIWSIVHLVTGTAMGWVMQPFVALAIMVLWEPLEILILSPLLARVGIRFGYESLNNSLSDIFFNVVGVALGFWLLTYLVSPPFHLF
jgi:hypothetical protein